jgi:uncharacterized protein YqgC (DUF456 family)
VILALLGAMIGSLAGAVVGLPLPLIGSAAGALLFGCLGAAAGALLGESWKGTTLEHGVKVGTSAFWSRLAGTLGKLVVGLCMVVVAGVWAFAWAAAE